MPRVSARIVRRTPNLVRDALCMKIRTRVLEIEDFLSQMPGVPYRDLAMKFLKLMEEIDEYSDKAHDEEIKDEAK